MENNKWTPGRGIMEVHDVADLKNRKLEELCQWQEGCDCPLGGGMCEARKCPWCGRRGFDRLTLVIDDATGKLVWVCHPCADDWVAERDGGGIA